MYKIQGLSQIVWGKLKQFSTRQLVKIAACDTNKMKFTININSCLTPTNKIIYIRAHAEKEFKDKFFTYPQKKINSFDENIPEN